MHDVINEQVQELVRHRRVELGIGFEPDNNDGLDFHPLYMDRFVAVVPADSPLAQLPRSAGHNCWPKTSWPCNALRRCAC